MADYLFFGRITLDDIVTADGRLHPEVLGGGAVYAAVGARLWSDSVGVAARVPAAFPRERLLLLEANAIQLDAVDTSSRDHPFHVFFAYQTRGLRRDGQLASQFLRTGEPVPAHWRASGMEPSVDLPDPRPADGGPAVGHCLACHLAALPLSAATLLCADLRQKGVPRILLDPPSAAMDAQYWPAFGLLLRDVDVVLISARQIARLFQPTRPTLLEAARDLGAHGPALVIIKRGAQGQLVYLPRTGEHRTVPAYPAQVRDVTGAGHAYCGGFTVGLVETGDPVEAALRGGVSASFAVEGTGPLYPLDASPGLAEARLAALRAATRQVE